VKNGGFEMKEIKEINILKTFEVLSERILQLENDLNISQYRIDNLREALEKAEREARQ
jgi:hypothetical protein